MAATFLASVMVTHCRLGQTFLNEPMPSGPSTAPATRKVSTGLTRQRCTAGTITPAVPSTSKASL